MTIDNTNATVGFDDIAWGEGYVDVKTYGGATRRIKAISFKDIPYDEAQSLAEVLDKISKIIVSDDISLLAKQSELFIGLAGSLDTLKSVAETEPATYRLIRDNLEAILKIRDNLNAIHNVLDKATTIEKGFKQLQYIKCECDRLYNKNRDLNKKNQTLVDNALSKLTTQESLLKAQLELLSQQSETITNGHEMAKKFQTYNWRLQAVPPCGKLEFKIDDSEAAIVLQVPVLNDGDCNCDEIDKTKKFILPRTIVQDGQSVFPANNVTEVDRLYTYMHKVEKNSIAVLEKDGFIHLYTEDPVTRALEPYTGLKKGEAIEFYISQDPAMNTAGVTVNDFWGKRKADEVISDRLSNLLNDWLNALVKLTGLPVLSDTLGIFNQDPLQDEVIIPDNVTIKEAFQHIEDYLDKIPKNFLELPDTFGDFATKSLYMLRVNIAENAVEAVKLTASLVAYDDNNSNFGNNTDTVQKAIEKLKNIVDGMPDQITVPDIAARDALGAIDANTIVHVVDASADNTVTAGWAKYQFINGAWHKYISLDDLTHFQDHTVDTLLDRTDLKPGGMSGKVFREALDKLHLANGIFLKKSQLGLPANDTHPRPLDVQAKLDNFKDPITNLAPRNKLLYFNNSDDPLADQQSMNMVYYVDMTGNVYDITTTSEPVVFAPDNIVNPFIAGEPTLSEIENFSHPDPNVRAKYNVFITYNGYDTNVEGRTKYIYWVGSDGKATKIETWVIDHLNDYIQSLGMVNDGVGIYQKNSLTIGLTAGVLREYNPKTHTIDTHQIVAQPQAPFFIVTPDGNMSATSTTDYPIDKYWDGANIVVLPQANDAVFHSFFINRDGKLALLIGNKAYTTFAAATRLYGAELDSVPTVLDDYIYIGGLISRRDATRTNHPTRTFKINASKIGEIRVSGATKEQGLLMQPVPDGNALQNIAAPRDGETRQILNLLPGIVTYTFNSADNSGIRPADGSPGSWHSQYMTDPTTPVPDPLVGMLIFGAKGKLVSDGFLAVEPNKVVTGGATLFPQAMGMHPQWVQGNDIVFPADIGGVFLRNLQGKAGEQDVVVAEKQNFTIKVGRYDGNPNAGVNTVANAFDAPAGYKNIFNDDENAPTAVAEQLYLIVDTYTNSKVKTVDMTGIPLPNTEGDFVWRRDAGGNLTPIPINVADWKATTDNCVRIFSDMAGLPIPNNTDFTILDPVPAGFDLYSFKGFMSITLNDGTSGTQAFTIPLPVLNKANSTTDWVFVGWTKEGGKFYLRQDANKIIAWCDKDVQLLTIETCAREQYLRLPNDLTAPTVAGNYTLEVKPDGTRVFTPLNVPNKKTTTVNVASLYYTQPRDRIKNLWVPFNGIATLDNITLRFADRRVTTTMPTRQTDLITFTLDEIVRAKAGWDIVSLAADGIFLQQSKTILLDNFPYKFYLDVALFPNGVLLNAEDYTASKWSFYGAIKDVTLTYTEV